MLAMREHSQAFYLWKLLLTVRNWPLYLQNRFGGGRDHANTYKLRNGLRITTRSFQLDRFGINEVWLDEIYNPPGFNWNNCRTVIDVGANIGTFTLFAAAHAPEAKIYAFEPEEGTAAALQKNVDDNQLGNRITTEVKGIAGTEGERTFYVAGKCSWFGSFYKPVGESMPVTISVTTLAQVFQKYGITQCDFLKLDCEGAEYEILYGLPEELFERIGFIALEYHPFSEDPRDTPGALRAFLEEKGYQVTERPNEILYAKRVK